jgi:hypothetical protein
VMLLFVYMNIIGVEVNSSFLCRLLGFKHVNVGMRTAVLTDLCQEILA